MQAKTTHLSRALRIEKGQAVAFVGAGGKTTSMFEVARELAPAIVTTTTHLASSQDVLANRHILIYEDTNIERMLEEDLSHEVILVTGPLNETGDRLLAPTEDQIKRIYTFCKEKNIPFLIEADGSRRLSMKAPGPHEPAIPPFVDVVVVVAGLLNLGKPLTEEFVHRPEVFSALCGLSLGDTITPKALAAVLNHPLGGNKNIPVSAQKRLLLTNAITDVERANGGEVADLCTLTFDGVVICALNPLPGLVFAVKEKIAGIVLAGGASSRFGASKLLLEYEGKTFVKRIAETALFAGLDPVIVVTGKDDAALRKALADVSVKIVHNERWMDGQSTSVKAGLGELPSTCGGAIFLLGDQPQISSEFIQALVERHSRSSSAVVASLVGGKRSNPVLFDRSTFPDFSLLEGDAGGRQLLPKYDVNYLEWFDGKMLIDVDTVEDYQRLIEYDLEEDLDD